MLNIVGSTSLSSPTTSFFLFNQAEINNMLNQRCWTIWPQPKAPSTRIRFHIVFIETANFSLRFHRASTRKRSKTMTVFTENANFWERSPKWKDLKTQWYCCRVDESLSLKTQTFENDTTATTNYSNYFDMQTIDFGCFLPFSIFFHRFRVDGWKRYDNDTKTTCRRNTIVAFSSKTISFSINTYSCWVTRR